MLRREVLKHAVNGAELTEWTYLTCAPRNAITWYPVLRSMGRHMSKSLNSHTSQASWPPRAGCITVTLPLRRKSRWGATSFTPVSC